MSVEDIIDSREQHIELEVVSQSTPVQQFALWCVLKDALFSRAKVPSG